MRLPLPPPLLPPPPLPPAGSAELNVIGMLLLVVEFTRWLVRCELPDVPDVVEAPDRLPLALLEVEPLELVEVDPDVDPAPWPAWLAPQGRSRPARQN